jgi:hypothetical protein
MKKKAGIPVGIDSSPFGGRPNTSSKRIDANA